LHFASSPADLSSRLRLEPPQLPALAPDRGVRARSAVWERVWAMDPGATAVYGTSKWGLELPDVSYIVGILQRDAVRRAASFSSRTP
jgi:hypothetical protein